MIELVETVVLAAFVVVFPIYSAVTWPAFVAAARRGEPDVRVRAYREVVLLQWSLTLVLLGCWTLAERPWDRLGLGVPALAGVLGLVAVAILGVLAFVQVRGVRNGPDEMRAVVQQQLGDVVVLMPHDRRELRWFRGVAVTAGFCEEVTYRGILPLALAAWLPPLHAVLAATLAFGLAHAYQGPRGIAKTAAVGAVMALVVWLTDSLWPAIALHVLVDLHGGEIGHAVCREGAIAES